MKLDHLIFTRFSLPNAFPQVEGNLNPLDPEFIKLRISLINMVCLPSILSQTNQDFAWIIIIDKNLPFEWRNAIKEISSSKHRSHILEYPGDQRKIGNQGPSDINWVKEFVLPETEYLITTILDDDDALPTNYVNELQNHVLSSTLVQKQIPAMILGASKITQWDLKFCKQAPYGFKCPWHRTKTQASSCGFSMVCKFPEISLSVLGLKHVVAFDYFSFSKISENPFVNEFRNAFIRQSSRAGYELETLYSKDISKEMTKDMSDIIGHVLMTNHTKNAEHSRLNELKTKYELVLGPQSFTNFKINWSKVDECGFLFRSEI